MREVGSSRGSESTRTVATVVGRVWILVRDVASLAVPTWLVSFPLLAVAVIVAVIFEYTGVPYPGGEVFAGAFFAVAFLLALKIDGPYWSSEAERLVRDNFWFLCFQTRRVQVRSAVKPISKRYPVNVFEGDRN